MSYKPTHLDRLPADGVLDKSGGVEPYVFSDDIVIAVDVALATDRPLLVSGHPGSGKSRLADAVAAVQGWNLLAKTMTSRTRLESLTVEVDQLRRLNDAQARGEGVRAQAGRLLSQSGPLLVGFPAGDGPPARAVGMKRRNRGSDLPYPGSGGLAARPITRCF